MHHYKELFMIEIENLTKFYGELCALDQISFQVKKGEVLGLLGPNAAGKTTTLRILTCYLNPTNGTIKVKDFDVSQDPQRIKSLMGYLPENAPLYPDMLVYDYLDYTADIRQLARENKSSRIKYLADICGIKEVMHQPVGELSRGYKQRVGLAQAMMGNPEILVLDEPTSGLDPNQIAEIREIIKEIGKEKTVILSTHILSEAEATCDRVVIINKGKIVADSRIEDLKKSIGKGSSVMLSLKNTRFDQAENILSGIPGITKISQQPSRKDQILNLSLSCEPSEAIRTDIYKTIKNQDWILLSLYPHTQSLEHIFRELTKEN
jgi:ABC-2 type transport system ATP-binding protein